MSERKIVFSGRMIDVCVERVEMPNGVETELELILHPGAAAVVPFTAPDRVLLIRQFRHAAGGTIWEVPAGKLDPGEDPAHCAGRELEEETGYRAGRLDPLGSIWTTPGFTNEVIHLFAAHDLSHTAQKLEADEVIEVVEVTLSEALDKIWSGELRDAKSLAALLHAARRVGALG